MISSRRLAQMARKWLRAAAAGRKSIVFHKRGAAIEVDSDACSTAAPARKGYFVVYSCDGQRFEVPLACLKSVVFGELLKMSEELFGLPGAARITLPCDAAFVRSVVSCQRRRSSRETERALLASMAALSCSTTLAPCSLLLNQLPQVVCGC
ncbi:hypothetical protein Taro_050632 [Colocasia esculenta]|uniref:Uncharacterized protein n=1 Tax=Colocasia esculenta TaxID=4460 RepID=A0A843XER8_COLES|nr:hypothetical protein [Colocasia esculenta]